MLKNFGDFICFSSLGRVFYELFRNVDDPISIGEWWHMNKRIVLFSFALIVVFAVAGRACLGSRNSDTRVMQLELMDRIWIPENGKYTPYFILAKTADDYLLLREHTTGPCAFSFSDSPNSFYANSALDEFLNVEFVKRFSPEVQSFFLESDVVITSESSIGSCGEDTDQIQRVFFAPSWTEVTGRHNSTGLQEGALLSEKLTMEYRKATNDDGELSVWWLRTPDTWYTNRVHCINEEGGVSSASTLDDTGVYKADVRPAFRISSQIPIVFEYEQWRMQINAE